MIHYDIHVLHLKKKSWDFLDTFCLYRMQRCSLNLQTVYLMALMRERTARIQDM